MMIRVWMNIVVLATPILLLAACSSGKETGTGTAVKEEALRIFEAEFDPTAYNPDSETVLQTSDGGGSAPVETAVPLSNPAPPELVQGFRVQIYASTSIDQASEQKGIAEELFPEEWFYLVFDPPTYKIRAGNFLTRFEADRFLKELESEGFRDAWIVPDKVQKNPPQRSTVPAPGTGDGSPPSGNDE